MTLTSSIPRCVGPSQMREMAVRAAGDDGGVYGFKLWIFVAEGDDLGRADKGEVERIEEEDDPLSTIILQSYFLEVTVDHGLHSGEGTGVLRKFSLVYCCCCGFCYRSCC